MNKRWNKEEEKKLIELFMRHRNYELIAEELNRSTPATKLRMESIIYDNMIGGKKIEDIALKLNRTNDQIAEMYYTHKNFKKGKGETVQDIPIFEQIKKKEPVINSQKGGDPSNRISRIEKENHRMKTIIENYQMKKNITKLFRAGKIDKSIIRSIKHIDE